MSGDEGTQVTVDKLVERSEMLARQRAHTRRQLRTILVVLLILVGGAVGSVIASQRIIAQ